MEVIDWRTPRGIARLGCVLLLVMSLGTIDAAAQEAPDSDRRPDRRSSSPIGAGQQSKPEDCLPQPRQLQTEAAGGQDQAASRFQHLRLRFAVAGTHQLYGASRPVRDLSRHRPHSRHQHEHHDSQPADGLHLRHRRSTAAHALQDQPVHSRTGIVGRAGRAKGARGANLDC